MELINRGMENNEEDSQKFKGIFTFDILDLRI